MSADSFTSRALYKFNSALAEVLYSLDPDETAGTVDDIGWHGLFAFEADEIVTGDFGTFTVPAGTYTLAENGQGFVSVDDGREVFDAARAADEIGPDA